LFKGNTKVYNISYIPVWIVLNAFLFRCRDKHCAAWRRFLTGKDS